jgi:hypothetical protein
MINCTAEVFEKLYDQDDWKQIFLNTKHLRIPTDTPLNLDKYVNDQPDFWQIIDESGNITVHPNEAVLDEIQNNPDAIIQYPKDIFIVDPLIEAKISRKHGVTVISDKGASSTPLKWKWTGRARFNKPFSWSYFFNARPITDIPNNALIITDLYLFDPLDKGVENLLRILDEILPQSFDFDYHIMVITCTNNGKRITSQRIVEETQIALKELKRSYPLILEMFFICDSGREEIKKLPKVLKNLYSASHNRRIYSNSFIVFCEHGYNTVKEYNDELQSRWDQKVELMCNYHGIDNKYEKNDELPVNFVDDYLSYLSEVITSSQNVGEYFRNGKRGEPQNIVNRLIR